MIIVPTEKKFDWKHTPIVLFFIILANVFIFFFYQSDDGEKIEEALTSYYEHEFFDVEWPIFLKYMEETQDPMLEEYKRLHETNAFQQLSYMILARADFYEHISRNAHDLIGYFKVDNWAEPRRKIHESIQSVSSMKHGLNPRKFNVSSLITHQFLHGGFMHIFGNMVFLIICGFAVEAAIGHLRFAIFYLLSGVAGGLLHMLVESDSYMPLVGASGSISGVMAMYLGIFRFKKIEFFYWFVVFVGYIRVPALTILPFYIGKELYSFYGDETSNVAFMAHTGGFIAGAALTLGTFLINRDVLNEEYIEDDQQYDKDQSALIEIHKYIDAYKFQQAIETINQHMEAHGKRFDLLLLRFKLSKMLSPKACVKAMHALAGYTAITHNEATQLFHAWADIQELQPHIHKKAKVRLANTLTDHGITDVAEHVVADFQDDSDIQVPVGKLASRLSSVFKERGELDASKRFTQLAQNIMGEAK